MAPTVHSPKGVCIGLLLWYMCASLGVAWLAWILVIPSCWIAHWIIDIPIHFEFVHLGSAQQFADAMLVDPKNRIKALITEKGFGWVFGKGGRERVANSPGNRDLAYPEPLKIFPLATLGGVADVIASGALALFLVWRLLPTHPEVAAIGLWGAACAVAPDLVLFGPIHQPLIKRFDWFWRLDTFHHAIHTIVLEYKKRWLGLVIQSATMSLFIALAYSIIQKVIGR
jgi:hypothetical protein